MASSGGGAHFGGQLSSMQTVETDESRELAGVGIRGSGSRSVGVCKVSSTGCDFGETDSTSIAWSVFV